ncbi:HIT family protein [Euzebya tangerina]|uniref:HIT family protein n=1 Tax=Euzebya tangerina TaxID=591198 RepID=UPI000E318B84|nr:HIT family protein [Euzebya tangerina]
MTSTSSDSPFADAADHPPERCVFCRIIEEEAKDQPLVYSDEDVVAFLDIRPLFPGHLLICPRQHVVTLDQLPPEQVPPVFHLVQRATAAMKLVLGAQGAFVANNNIVSQSVHHLHIHVVPRTKGDGLRGFFWPRVDYDDDGHRADVEQRLRAALAG